MISKALENSLIFERSLKLSPLLETGAMQPFFKVKFYFEIKLLITPISEKSLNIAPLEL